MNTSREVKDYLRNIRTPPASCQYVGVGTNPHNKEIK
jgi:hypothetical protein